MRELQDTKSVAHYRDSEESAKGIVKKHGGKIKKKGKSTKNIEEILEESDSPTDSDESSKVPPTREKSNKRQATMKSRPAYAEDTDSETGIRHYDDLFENEDEREENLQEEEVAQECPTVSNSL